MVLKEELLPLLDELWYPSESDEPIELIHVNAADVTLPLTPDSLVKLLSLDPAERIVEKEPTKFWDGVTTLQDWYDETETERTKRFIRLKEILDNRLTGQQYFEVGEIEVDAYLIGLRTEGELAGIKTMIVRT